MATPTQQYGYKQVVELESPESQALDRSRTIFFRMDGIGVAHRSLFFRFGQVRNLISYRIWRFRFTLNYFSFLQYLFYIYPLDLQECDGGAVHRKQLSNYPDLLPEMPKNCCPIKIFYFVF